MIRRKLYPPLVPSTDERIDIATIRLGVAGLALRLYPGPRFVVLRPIGQRSAKLVQTLTSLDALDKYITETA